MTMESNGMSSRDYAREAEHTRHRLAKGLKELNDRLTPGQIVDEVLTYAKGGGGTFFRTLNNAAKDNPIPSLLIGAGCMMFLSEKMGLHSFSSGSGDQRSYPAHRIAEGMSQSGRQDRRYSDASGSTLGAAADYTSTQAAELAENVSRGAASTLASAKQGLDAVADTATGAAQRLRESAHDLQDRAAEGAGKVKETAQGLGETAQGYASAVGDSLSTVQQRAVETGHRVTDRATALFQEQPLLVAAVGVAVGAAIAALIPSTRTEDELMGSTSDAVKSAAGEVASEQFASASAAAGRVAEEVRHSAEREGLTVAAAVDTARKVGDKVKKVVGNAAEASKSELEEITKAH